MKATRAELQKLLDRSKFIRGYGFRVVRAANGACTIALPFRPVLERPGGVVNGPALMAAADCAMWVAIKRRLGMQVDAVTAELNTAFLNAARRETVLCTARILKLGKRSIYGVAECHARDGRLFSHHTVTYSRLA